MNSSIRSLGLWLLSATSAASLAVAADPIELEKINGRYSNPVLLTHAGDGSGRLFVVEQRGHIRVVDGGRLLDQTFLSLAGELSSGFEQGLLGLAFHPDFETNGFFFVNYTDRRGDTIVSRFAVSGNPNRADKSSEVEVISYDQPSGNHNGGHLAFGPDGYLYISSGDGGGAGDPQNNAQSLDTLLGKILRIDVDGLPYAIPADNPFVGNSAALDETWAYGLRNPWRFSFDRNTGDLYIGDVGQSREEEIDFQPAGSPGGENYGWRLKEGNRCFNPTSGCGEPGLVAPILTFGHGDRCSVTGGFVYRGSADPGLRGMYLYGDFCSGEIWAAEPGAGGNWRATELLDTDFSISSFGEDEAGEVYVVDREGAVYRIIGSSLLIDGFESGTTGAWNRSVGRVAVVEPGLDRSGFALQVEATGTKKRSFLLTKRPDRESTLSVTLRVNPAELDLDGGRIDILHLAAGKKPIAVLRVIETGSSFEAVLRVRQDVGGFIEIGRTTIKRSGETRLGVEWGRASGGGSADGFARLIKGSRARAERTDLQNRRWVIKTVRLGLPKGSKDAVGGSLLLDQVIISR